MDNLRATLTTAAWILSGIAALSLLEAVIPLRARGHSGRAHLAPNLVLSVLTLATSAPMNLGLVLALALLERSGRGVLHHVALPPWAATAVVLVALDLSFYVAHVAMHHVPAFWRFHRVHHGDPAVDVTTTLRQHPGEGVIRYAFLAACALPLGASPGAFASYQLVSALCALLEHANLRLPPRLDALLSLVFTWPGLHKVHHSRDVRFTDTNYGNLLSWWDRLFSTFTPARMGANVVYGLDGAASRSAAALLTAPFRGPAGAIGRARPLA